MVLIRSFSLCSAPVLHEPLRDGQERLLDEGVERVRFDIADESRDLPSLAIRPQDRVHVDIRHAAPKLQVCVRDRQERPRRLSRPPGRSSRPCRLLQVPDGRHNHGRPQTSIATLLRHFSVTSLAHRAHATSHHHHVRKSPHRRPPVERALVKPCRRPSSREGTVSSGSSRISTGDGHVSGVRGMCAPTTRPKLDRSARTH